MKVLLVNPYALPHLGGVETAVESLALGLSDLGHEATILASACGEGEPPTGPIRRVRVPAWNVLETALRVPFPVFSTVLNRTTREAVADADVVHVHGFLSQTSMTALTYARRARKPIVITEHVGFVRYPNPAINLAQKAALFGLSRMFVRSASALICLNNRVEEWLKDLVSERQSLTLIPNGIDIRAFRPPDPAEKSRARVRLGLDPERPLALFVGRPAPKKHLERLLSERHPDFDLLLCGPDLATHASPTKGIHVICAQPSEMPEVFWAADVFALPSEDEGFPMSVMEAMASGLPVVVCRDRAYESQVTEDEVIQTHADGRSVRDAILGILRDPGRAKALSVAARKKAEADFSRERCVQRHTALYRSVVT